MPFHLGLQYIYTRDLFIHFIGSYQENNLSPAAPFTQIIHQKEIHYPVVREYRATWFVHLFLNISLSLGIYIYLVCTVKVTYTHTSGLSKERHCELRFHEDTALNIAHCPKNNLNLCIKPEQMQRDNSDFWASALSVTGSVLLWRIRLFLGQCSLYPPHHGDHQ